MVLRFNKYFKPTRAAVRLAAPVIYTFAVSPSQENKPGMCGVMAGRSQASAPYRSHDFTFPTAR